MWIGVDTMERVLGGIGKEDIDTFYSSCIEFNKKLDNANKELDKLADRLAEAYRIYVYKKDPQILSTSLENILRELQRIHFGFKDNYDDVELKYKELDKQFESTIATCSRGIQQQRDNLSSLSPKNYRKRDIIILHAIDHYNAAIEAASKMRKIESAANKILMEFSGALGRISVIFTVISKFYNSEETSKLEEEIELLQKMKEESIRRYIR